MPNWLKSFAEKSCQGRSQCQSGEKVLRERVGKGKVCWEMGNRESGESEIGECGKKSYGKKSYNNLSVD